MDYKDLDGSSLKKFIDEAMSNNLVLLEIFRNLSYKDLLSCAQVSRLWKLVAEPIMCHYRTVLECSHHDHWTVKAKKFIGLHGTAKDLPTDFQSLLQDLRATRGRGAIISIDLTMVQDWDDSPPLHYLLPFLSEFGFAVRIFDCQVVPVPFGFDFKAYCSCLSHFPNLESLKCNKHFGLIDDGDIQDAERPALPRLKRVYIGNDVCARYWNHVLQMAPNVEVILEFPFDCADMLRPLGIQRALKSIFYPDSTLSKFCSKQPDLRSFKASLEVLADLGVQLTSLSIPDFHHFAKNFSWNPEEGAMEGIRTQFCRILESSKDSMTILDVPTTKYMVHYFPVPFRMERIKILHVQEHEGEHLKSVEAYKLRRELFFPDKFNLNSVFPNLEVLEIYYARRSCDLTLRLPQEIFGQHAGGNSVKSLKTDVASEDCFKYLTHLFPGVTKLSIELNAAEFEKFIPTIAVGWPLLEVLKVSVPFSECPGCVTMGKRFLYLHLHPINRVTPPGLYEGISEDDREEYSSLNDDILAVRQMRNLKKLEFVLEGRWASCFWCRRTHIPATVLSIGDVFKELPDLEMAGYYPDAEELEIKTKFSHFRTPDSLKAVSSLRSTEQQLH